MPCGNYVRGISSMYYACREQSFTWEVRARNSGWFDRHPTKPTHHRQAEAATKFSRLHKIPQHINPLRNMTGKLLLFYFKCPVLMLFSLLQTSAENNVTSIHRGRQWQHGQFNMEGNFTNSLFHQTVAEARTQGAVQQYSDRTRGNTLSSRFKNIFFQ